MMLRTFVCAVLATLTLGIAPAAAAWLPERPVRIVVPFAAGGPTDTVARIVADEMAIALKQPVYVDNITGSGGVTGVLRFLEEASDGHTLLMGHMGTHGSAPASISDLGYDPIDDFEPVGLAAGTPIIITAGRHMMVRDLSSLEDAMAWRGPGIRLAHAGRGSVSHSGALLLKSVLGVDPTLVAYNGTGPALNDLISGQVDVLVDQIVNVAPAVATKKVAPIAMASAARSPILPNVPTAQEAGVQMRMDAWNALFAKRGTPPEQIAVLHAALRHALNKPSSRARLLDLGAEVPDEKAGSPQALADLVRDEIKRWSETLYELR